MPYERMIKDNKVTDQPLPSGCVWWGVLDDRYHVEVQIGIISNVGNLLIFDTADNNSVIFNRAVGLALTQYGPDTPDVQDWMAVAEDFIDKLVD